VCIILYISNRFLKILKYLRRIDKDIYINTFISGKFILHWCWIHYACA